MEQLQSILNDLDNKAITKHQAYDLILVLFDVVRRSEQVYCRCIKPDKVQEVDGGALICDYCKELIRQ